MICGKCGNRLRIEDNMYVCDHCYMRYPIPEEEPPEPPVTALSSPNQPKKKVKRTALIISCAAAAAALIAGAVLLFCTDLILPGKKCENAERLMTRGMYADAIEKLDGAENIREGRELLRKLYRQYHGAYRSDEPDITFAINFTGVNRAHIFINKPISDTDNVIADTWVDFDGNEADFNFTDSMGYSSVGEIRLKNDCIILENDCASSAYDSMGDWNVMFMLEDQEDLYGFGTVEGMPKRKGSTPEETSEPTPRPTSAPKSEPTAAPTAVPRPTDAPRYTPARPVEQPSYRTVTHRSGASFAVPAHFIDRSSGDTICYELADKSALMTVSVKSAAGCTVQGEFDRFQNKYPGECDYKGIYPELFTTSQNDGVTSWYEYCVFHKGYVYTFEFISPLEYDGIYSQYIEHIYASFKLP